MKLEEIMKLIQNGEKIDIEFKESNNALPKNIYDSVCSFNNRNGGHILLGVSDEKQIIGVNEDKIDKIIKEFTTSVNNSQKIYPPLYLTPVPVNIKGKTVIYIRVPEGYQVCRHNGKIWDRSYEGDINITNNSELVYKMYSRKQSTYFVNKVYPNLEINCLETYVIEKVRKMAVSRNQNHLWKNMNDEELLRSANLILIDPETNKEGITLAAILLFGKDNSIMSVLSQHKTDAIFRVENKDRYDDRDIVITNLIDSYDRLISFGQKHLNELFVLDGIVNVNARDRILREIISNTLAHRDYSSGFPAKMIIDDEKIIIENSNLSHGMGILDLQKFEPFPKNPSISKVFREIFRTIIPLKKIATQKVGGENVAHGVAHDVAHGVAHDKEKIITIIKEKIRLNNKITRQAIADEIGVSKKTIERHMKEINNLKYIGSGNNGYWELKE